MRIIGILAMAIGYRFPQGALPSENDTEESERMGIGDVLVVGDCHFG
jgi:hypothetical protein